MTLHIFLIYLDGRVDLAHKPPRRKETERSRHQEFLECAAVAGRRHARMPDYRRGSRARHRNTSPRDQYLRNV